MSTGLHCLPFTCIFTTSRRSGRDRGVNACKESDVNNKDSNKKANLSVFKKQRINLPPLRLHNNITRSYRFGEFFSHPSGVRSVLNTTKLQRLCWVDDTTCTCLLPKLQLLGFQASPLLHLRVLPTLHDCTVEMISCKFQGSELIESQNEHFSAFMKNRMTWNTGDTEPFLEVDMQLNVTLEIYTRPFTMLPTSAVEAPGNLMMQALVDKQVSGLMEQLLEDYRQWEFEQSGNICS